MSLYFHFLPFYVIILVPRCFCCSSDSQVWLLSVTVLGIDPPPFFSFPFLFWLKRVMKILDKVSWAVWQSLGASVLSPPSKTIWYRMCAFFFPLQCWVGALKLCIPLNINLHVSVFMQVVCVCEEKGEKCMKDESDLFSLVCRLAPVSLCYQCYRVAAFYCLSLLKCVCF